MEYIATIFTHDFRSPATSNVSQVPGGAPLRHARDAPEGWLEWLEYQPTVVINAWFMKFHESCHPFLAIKTTEKIGVHWFMSYFQP